MSDFDDRGHRPQGNSLSRAFKDIFRDAKRPEIWETEQDSRLFIRDIMRDAMHQRGMSAEELSQKANVPLETINAFLAGQGDLSDSEPLTKIERALRVNLSSW